MVNQTTPPSMRAGLFGGYEIIYFEPTKKAVSKCTIEIQDEAEAKRIFATITVKWSLNPLYRWSNQQEHLAAVLTLTFAERNGAIYRLNRTLKLFLALPHITTRQGLEFIEDKALPMLAQAMPGKTSRYFQHSIEVQEHLRVYFEANKHILNRDFAWMEKPAQTE